MTTCLVCWLPAYVGHASIPCCVFQRSFNCSRWHIRLVIARTSETIVVTVIVVVAASLGITGGYPR